MRRATVASKPQWTRPYRSFPCDVDGREYLAHEIEVLKFRRTFVTWLAESLWQPFSKIGRSING
jgi:hypothetical protein